MAVPSTCVRLDLIRRSILKLQTPSQRSEYIQRCSGCPLSRLVPFSAAEPKFMRQKQHIRHILTFLNGQVNNWEW